METLLRRLYFLLLLTTLLDSAGARGQGRNSAGAQTRYTISGTVRDKKYQVDGQTAFYYTERNGYRMPAYNRMDVAATMQGKKSRKFESSWTFSVYNLYGRENAYSVVFQNDPNDPSRTQALQYSLFRWVPSVTYNFKF